MRDYLLFRLYGPLAAWGDIAVGEYRPSFAYPSRSAIMGLIAGALGLRRHDVEAQRSLAESYHFGVRLDAMGSILRDYHTAQVPPTRKGIRHLTRRSELSFPNLNTILSTRDYRIDALYTVALWGVREPLPYAIPQLIEALKEPVFTLYLGRKSCPPSLPLQPQMVAANRLKEAFDEVRFGDALFLGDFFHPSDRFSVFWEGEEESGFDELHIISRRDDLLSSQRRQFGERREFYAGGQTGKGE